MIYKRLVEPDQASSKPESINKSTCDDKYIIITCKAYRPEGIPDALLLKVHASCNFLQ